MIRAFLDANVLFSAAHSPVGAGNGIVQLAQVLPGVDLLMTEHALNEAERNLRKKSPKSLPEFRRLKPTINVCQKPSAELESCVSEAAPLVPRKDLPILAGAVLAEVDWLVTYDDDHFGDLYGKEVHGVLILEPRHAVHLIRRLT